MNKVTKRFAVMFLVPLAFCLATLALGCFQENNEREFLRNSEPAKPPDVPNESVAERKARLRNKSVIEKKIEARAAKAAMKKANAQ